MWYKPNFKEDSKQRVFHEGIMKSRSEISNLLKEQIKIDDIDTDFLSYYKSQVFCNWSELDELEISKVDVVIFSGYAGCGHFAPSKALAEKYSKNGKEVIVIDPLFLYSEKAAVFNCRSWEFMAKNCHTAWKLIRSVMATQVGTEVIYGSAKKMLQKDRIIDFLIKKKVDIVLSCYPYANTIMTEISEHVKFAGIVVLDCSPVGFMNLPNKGKDVEKITYFVPGNVVREEGAKIYPYIQKSITVNIHGTPCMFDKIPRKNKKAENSNICLFIPGSGLGIGKGINSITSVAKNWKGKVIIVCGDNEQWIKKAQEISLIYPNVLFTGYVKHEILKKLMLMSTLIIAKPGASMKEEIAIIPGKNIAYGEISGQETHNAKKLSDERRAKWIKGKEGLEEYLSKNIEQNGDNIEYDLPFAVNTIYEHTKKFLPKEWFFKKWLFWKR